MILNVLELPTPLTKSVTAEIFESVNHLSLVLTHHFVPGFSGFQQGNVGTDHETHSSKGAGIPPGNLSLKTKMDSLGLKSSSTLINFNKVCSS